MIIYTYDLVIIKSHRLAFKRVYACTERVMFFFFFYDRKNMFRNLG